jgi:MAF protein
MLILASGSPRRKQLMTLAGWTFLTASADIDEQPLGGEPPQQYVMRLAQGKCAAVKDALADAENPAAIIVAADTTVALDGEILGKPAHAGDAQGMLRRLRGRPHQVYTALSLLYLPDSLTLTDLCETQVMMRDYSDQEIEAYISTGDPLDKAGAYAIQHVEFHPVESLDGCYANVVGLPLCRLNRLLEQAGIEPARRPQAVCLGFDGQPCSVAGWVMSQPAAEENAA